MFAGLNLAGLENSGVIYRKLSEIASKNGVYTQSFAVSGQQAGQIASLIRGVIRSMGLS